MGVGVGWGGVNDRTLVFALMFAPKELLHVIGCPCCILQVSCVKRFVCGATGDLRMHFYCFFHDRTIANFFKAVLAELSPIFRSGACNIQNPN